MTEDEAMRALQQELDKPLEETDNPRLVRLFEQTFTLRRNFICAGGQLTVQDICAKFPMLKQVDYVSSLPAPHFVLLAECEL